MAAKNKSVANSVCLNHPDRPADTRCITCFKPICNECVIEDDGNDFCSEDCRGKFVSSRAGVEAFQERERRDKKRRRIRRLVILVILIALGVAAYKYFSNNPDDLQELRQRTDSLREKAGEMVEEVKKK